MNAFYTPPERIAALQSSASSWAGTPYVADGAVKGAGVSCARLPHAILVESGFPLPDPPARGAMLRCQLLPTMLAWLEAREGTHFARLDAVAPVLPGDVLLYQAGTGHLALCTDARNVIHSWQGRGAHFSLYRADNTLRRLVGIWRPIVSES